jgi:hypothetical protein
MGKKGKDMVKKAPTHIVALYDHFPTEDDLFNLNEPSYVTPDTNVQLPMKKGQIFELTGEVDWWLFVKSQDQTGYIPSYLTVPIEYDQLTADE